MIFLVGLVIISIGTVAEVRHIMHRLANWYILDDNSEFDIGCCEMQYLGGSADVGGV